MIKYTVMFLMLLSGIVTNGLKAQTQTKKILLKAGEFATTLKSKPSASIIDIRTPAEFSEGHLVNSKNIDWYEASFESKISILDKSKPVFIYCKSGGRSAAAAAKMLAMGFKEVYELEGGITSWKAANLPLVK